MLHYSAPMKTLWFYLSSIYQCVYTVRFCHDKVMEAVDFSEYEALIQCFWNPHPLMIHRDKSTRSDVHVLGLWGEKKGSLLRIPLQICSEQKRNGDPFAVNSSFSIYTAMTCALIQQTEHKYARKQVSDHELSWGFGTCLKTEPSVLSSGEGFEPN